MGCNNNYKTKEEFFESYGSEDSIDNCEGCPSFVYRNGTVICEKFANNTEDTDDENK